jgi:predicted small secreted protein
MKAKIVVAAALILSACQTLPNGFGYVEAEGKHPANTQAHD